MPRTYQASAVEAMATVATGRRRLGPRGRLDDHGVERSEKCDFFYCCDDAVDSLRLGPTAVRACSSHQDALEEIAERARDRSQEELFVLVSAFLPRVAPAKRRQVLGLTSVESVVGGRL